MLLVKLACRKFQSEIEATNRLYASSETKMWNEKTKSIIQEMLKCSLELRGTAKLNKKKKNSAWVVQLQPSFTFKTPILLIVILIFIGVCS